MFFRTSYHKVQLRGRSLLASAAFVLMPLFLFSQKYAIHYTQFEITPDSSILLPSPFRPNPDTLAKWVYLYDNGRSIMKQTDDSPEVRSTSMLNRITNSFDSVVSYNMSKRNIIYIDHIMRRVRDLSYFFDVRYLIEDELPKYNWKHGPGKRTILNHECKYAQAVYPYDLDLVFGVWYTEDIPIEAGPMHLNGLPGTILEVERNGKLFYRAGDVTRLSDDTLLSMEKPYPTEKGITIREYNIIRFGVPFVNYNVNPPQKDSIR